MMHGSNQASHISGIGRDANGVKAPGNDGSHGTSSSALPLLERIRQPSMGATVKTALIGGLDRLSHGIAIVDADGHLKYANHAAQGIFDGVTRADLPGANAALPKAWIEALRKVCMGGLRQLLLFDLRDTSCAVVMSPLDVDGERLAFAVFGKDQLCGSVELQMFAQTCELTHAETMVLRKLSMGMSPAAIACEHGVACTTVVTQIAAVRSKTRCSSVRKLLTVLARMPPVNPLQLVHAMRSGA